MTEHGPYWILREADGTLVADTDGTPFLSAAPGMHFGANALIARRTALRVMLVELPVGEAKPGECSFCGASIGPPPADHRCRPL